MPSHASPALSLDLNADLGEGWGDWSMGDDAAMLDVVTTANVACGGHAGDGGTMRAACRAAAARGVAITAHVAYPDLQGFGRRFVDIAPSDLTDQVVVQAGALQAMARAEGTAVRGVKPHGALYNTLAHHEAQAGAVVRALTELGDLPLVAAPGAVAVGVAEEAGLEVVLEGFADRAYLPDGTLTPRRVPGAVLTEASAVTAQALAIATEQRVRTADGEWIPLPVRSLCLHGDTPGAVSLARTVRAALEDAGVRLQAVL
ncbi:LamB/YcsF family protein [Brachybacterium saurashtrense]|uniref:LamB/YcsF family protein n=1 Tax=Brachybacterium saurashtrense TaxID=556288 RepID=A0A345YR12_9MICO|nr:5-oxoprolinase subunit PxpA [Brachybacterium saurashtrense]AXK46364.1 LamB/YcsF family protein [Brachybacterium saurashtrense]RRR24104.1 LamB/YcsF family protein [Brachybacterium saurashtrense]